MLPSQADLKRADYYAKQRAMEDALMALEVKLVENGLWTSCHMLPFVTILRFKGVDTY